MSDLHESRKKNGYDSEEFFFERLNRELIDRIKRRFGKKKREAEARTDLEQSSSSHDREQDAA